MKGYMTVEFSNGEHFFANIRGRGIQDLDDKAIAIVNRLERPATREAKRWTIRYGETLPGFEFCKVSNARNYHVSGIVYMGIPGKTTSIIKRLR